MTLTVETGSGSATAESYATVAEADTYHDNRGNTTWDSVDNKEAALRKATDYLVQTYRSAWKGVRMTATQALDWPRAYVYTTPFVNGASGSYPYLVADDVVPTEVKNACIELALKAASAELSPDLTKDIISQSVGPISTTYSESSPQYKRYKAVDAMLRPYLSSQSSINAATVRS